jgi:SRSO17 transposase
MIHNDKELQGTQERIAYFCKLVTHMRQIESAANFKYMASGYLAEIEKMHTEVMAYLHRHPSESPPAQAA